MISHLFDRVDDTEDDPQPAVIGNTLVLIPVPPPKPLNPTCAKDTKCDIFHWLPEDDLNRLDHIQKERHTCKWGWDCRMKLRDKQHSQNFIHEQLPKCQQDDLCPLMEDPDHRSKENHTKMWCYLVPCKNFHNNKKCNACDKTKYYH